MYINAEHISAGQAHPGLGAEPLTWYLTDADNREQQR